MRTQLGSGTAAALIVPSAAPVRGLVLIPDIMGLRPLFEDLGARLAADYRWAVCAIEPFPGQEHLATVEERFAVLPAMDDHRVVGDAVAAADVLAAEAGCERVAVLGFCMGGMYTYKAAASGRFDRAVSFYGMVHVPPPWRGPGQQDPLELLTAAPRRCPTLAIVGEQDPYTPPADVDALRALPGIDVVAYPNAEHGFVHDPSRPAHRPDDARDAWSRVAAFLGGGISGPGAPSGRDR